MTAVHHLHQSRCHTHAALGNIKTYYWFKYSGLAAIDWILSSKSGAVWQDHPELKVPAQAQCRTLFTVFVWQIHIKCKIVQHICIGVQPELYRLHKRLWYCFVLSCYRLRIILGWTSDRKFKNNCWSWKKECLLSGIARFTSTPPPPARRRSSIGQSSTSQS